MKKNTFADNADIVWEGGGRLIAGWKNNVRSYSTTKSQRWENTGLNAF